MAQGLGHQRREAGGGETHLLDGVKGALAGGVEFAQLLEILTKEFEANRQFGTHRKQVDDVAAATPAALLLDAWHLDVAEARQGGGQFGQVDAGAPPQHQALVGQGPGGWQVGLQGALGADNRPAAGGFAVFGHQLGQHLQLPPGDFSGGVKGFVGGTLTGGIELAGGPAHQFEQGGPAARLLQGGHHHQ